MTEFQITVRVTLTTTIEPIGSIVFEDSDEDITEFSDESSWTEETFEAEDGWVTMTVEAEDKHEAETKAEQLLSSLRFDADDLNSWQVANACVMDVQEVTHRAMDIGAA